MVTLGKNIASTKTNDPLFAQAIAQTIKTLFKLLVAELKAHTKTCEKLCDALRPMFNTNGRFYGEHFTSSSPSGSVMTPSDFSASDVEWRNSLKEGIEVMCLFSVNGVD